MTDEQIIAAITEAVPGLTVEELRVRLAAIHQDAVTVPAGSTPTDTWTVTDATGLELVRVSAPTRERAHTGAMTFRTVHAANLRDGGIALRRLRSHEL